ncbi:archaellin/type IV pilin N-terminal domain-containing protein [Methanoculleus thermophilus]|uniref:Flagellin n=1 Tax=Methanoculleus thermophilus TaxID=2200 RepID=A0A1G9AIS5_9EURY|nr:archaellin/type IV pilin N-terminal domain-containing protein [Methanoculleus thermophilus]SDK26724.1 flagellin FlaB [Methanoculleus thermophilus]
MMKLFKNEDAFTGLEAAIVLIAFVVVAAVFSYVMLGAGFYATQEAQRTVHTGSQQASSSMEIIGNVYGHAQGTGTAAYLDYIEFTVGNTAGGSPIDITQTLVTYVCGEKSDVIPYDTTGSIVEDTGTGVIDSGKWGVNKTYNDVGGTRNKLLEPGEQFVLRVYFPDQQLRADTRFSVNLQPAIGAAYPIKKTVPATLYPMNVL